MARITKSEQPREGALSRVPPRAISPFEEMDRMFESFFGRPLSRGWMGLPFEPGAAAAGGYVPRMDVIDQDDSIVIRAEMPGVNKEDIEVSTTDHTVTIRASTHEEEKTEKGEYYRCELAHGEIVRSVGLPADVDEEKAHAKLENGILELVLPKRETSKRRNIKVE